MKYLLFIFLCSSAFGSYVKQDAIGVCGNYTFYKNSGKCESREGQNCVALPAGYNCNFHESAALMVDDLDNQTGATKSETELCVAVADDVGTASVNEAQTQEENCQSRLVAKVCTDSQETAIKNLDLMEVYCSKPIYAQMDSGRKTAIENASLKTAYQASQAEKLAIDAKEADMRFGHRLYAAVKVMNDAKGLTKGQKRALRTNLAEIRDDLFDGSICSAREDIAALTPDGTLITASDITAVLAKIDAEKTCP